MELSSNSGSIKYEIARAIAELYEAYEFLGEIAELPLIEMFVKAWERDKPFIEHIKTIDETPRNAIDFWFAFYMWTISWLASRYYYIWQEVLDAWSRSDIRKKLRDRANLFNAIWSNIEQILSDARF